MTVLRSLALAFLVAVAFFTTSVAHPRSAEACGPLDPLSAVTFTVRDHFAGRTAHDRDLLLEMWSPGATVVTIGKQARTETIERAADRWLGANETVTFQIEDVKVQGDSADVRVAVQVDGEPSSSTIHLVNDKANRVWRITHETSRPVS